MRDGLPPGLYPQALLSQVDAALRQQLLPGERVVWSAQPRLTKQWPVFLIWLGMLATPFRLLRKARQLVYALTDQRLIRHYAGRKTKVESVQIDQLGQVDASHDADGYGRLSIATTQFIDGNRDHRTDAFTLLGIPDSRRLERLLLEAMRARRGAG